MAQEDFNDLLWFLAVAQEKSFTKAAARLGVAQSTLSNKITQLEARMGLRLLARTTRSVAVTEAGERLQQSLEPHIGAIEADIDSLMALKDRPSGRIRITLSDHPLERIVWPKMRQVMRDYPDIKLELSRDNGLRNIVEDGFDAGVRLGESVEKDMIAVRIGPDWRMLVVASPEYVAAHGKVDHPNQLIDHNCMNMRFLTSGAIYSWEFAKEGQDLRVKVDGQLTFNTIYPMVEATLDGFGISYVPEEVVADHLAAGRLVSMIEEWCPYFGGFHLYYPSRRQNSPAFQVVVDALRYRAAT